MAKNLRKILAEEGLLKQAATTYRKLANELAKALGIGKPRAAHGQKGVLVMASNDLSMEDFEAAARRLGLTKYSDPWKQSWVLSYQHPDGVRVHASGPQRPGQPAVSITVVDTTPSAPLGLHPGL